MKANDIRRGIVIMYNKVPHRVIEFRHHTPGNLRAMVQTKLRNLLSGTQTDVRIHIHFPPWSLQGTRYISTNPDNTRADNLLSLPEC